MIELFGRLLFIILLRGDLLSIVLLILGKLDKILWIFHVIEIDLIFIGGQIMEKVGCFVINPDQVTSNLKL